ncbi:MAG: TIGR02996 domain-containing protein [Gemmataceae bacterium]|nr:TIGR02996 domain-containing protein [Gemmataceae bacterium]
MSDEAALLRAIADAPDDIPLRLVYADFCEENGRDQRAALIRGQCALDPLLVSADEDGFGVHSDDIRLLSTLHFPRRLQEDLCAPFRALVDEAAPAFGRGGMEEPPFQFYAGRGFVEELFVLGIRAFRRFLMAAPGLLGQVPLLSLRVHAAQDDEDPSGLLDPGDLRTLLRLERIERLLELDLEDYALDEHAARVLLEEGHRLRLGSLVLRSHELPQLVIAEIDRRFGAAVEFHIPF